MHRNVVTWSHIGGNNRNRGFSSTNDNLHRKRIRRPEWDGPWVTSDNKMLTDHKAGGRTEKR